MRVVVAGGGIGGLAAALALSRHGHEVQVLERATAFGEVGAGIQVSPNAARVLEHLGLGEALGAIAVHPERIVVRRWQDDRVLRTTNLGPDYRERYGHAYANVARPDLIGMLADAVAHDRSIEVRHSVVVTGASNEGARARVHLADGSSVDADLVIGADGIHSAIRDVAVGPHPSRFSGGVAYRALVPRERVPDEPLEVTNRMGPGGHVVSYFVGRRASHFNLVCIAPEDTWDVEGWTEPATVDDLRARFVGWSPRLTALLDAVEEPIFRWALHDREPLQRWGTGRITLLGDACHPMLPFMAQGACQAIEDAAVLARSLDDAATIGVEPALRRYEDTRRERTAKVQTLSWRNRIVYHLPDGEEQEKRDASMARVSDDPGANDWLHGYDPLTADLAVLRS